MKPSVKSEGDYVYIDNVKVNLEISFFEAGFIADHCSKKKNLSWILKDGKELNAGRRLDLVNKISKGEIVSIRVEKQNGNAENIALGIYSSLTAENQTKMNFYKYAE